VSLVPVLTTARQGALDIHGTHLGLLHRLVKVVALLQKLATLAKVVSTTHIKDLQDTIWLSPTHIVPMVATSVMLITM
jgi:hypothetical protein